MLQLLESLPLELSIMDIISLNFDEPLKIVLNGDVIQLVAFKPCESGSIKFGIDAPRSVQVHREEIYHAIREQAVDA